MTPSSKLLAVAAATCLTTACTTTSAYMEPAKPIAQLRDMTVTGNLAYRERVALAPGSTLTVKLIDVSRADAPSETLAEESRLLEGEQVPLPFSLSVKEHKLKTNMRYAVRATITDAFGRLAWTTDTAHLIDPTKMEQDLGRLQLVKVALSPTPVTALIGNTWMIENIANAGIVDRSAPSITFASNGTVSGATGCNNFTGSYTVDGDRLNIGTLTTTKKACIPALADQESRLLRVVSDITGWSEDRWGRMVLTTSDGRILVATK